MSKTGDTRRSHSATFFTSSRKQGEDSNPKPNKRFREEETNPSILVSGASTDTLIEEPTSINTSYLQPSTPTHTYINKEQVAVKLNRLKDKSARYESHKEFLSNCIQSKLIPKGLKLELEPTIGNYDQEFLDNWYAKLKDFSLILMKDIVQFCSLTVQKTNEDIKSTEETLRKSMENEEFNKVKATIKENEEATKRLLQQRKFKKFNHLKHNPKPEKIQRPESQVQHEKQQKEQISYASAVTKNIPTTRTNKQQSENPSKGKTLEEHLKSMHPSKQSHKRANSPSQSRPPSRSQSKTTQHNYDEQIAKLQEEIKHLKQSKNNEKNNIMRETNKENYNNENPKNLKQASQNGGQIKNIELLSVITFIDETMKTLTSYAEQLRNQLDIDMIPQEM